MRVRINPESTRSILEAFCPSKCNKSKCVHEPSLYESTCVDCEDMSLVLKTVCTIHLFIYLGCHPFIAWKYLIIKLASYHNKSRKLHQGRTDNYCHALSHTSYLLLSNMTFTFFSNACTRNCSVSVSHISSTTCTLFWSDKYYILRKLGR